MDELLDILDELGQPTGTTQPRSVVHSTGLWHAVVHIYFYRIVDGEVELVVHHRAKTKDLYPDRWDTRFGGHVKAGDSLETAVKKEVQEEAGITMSPDKLVVGPTQKHEQFPNNEFYTSYFYNFTGDINTLSFKDGEVQAAKWMKAKDILADLSQHPDLWAPKLKGTTHMVQLIQALK